MYVLFNVNSDYACGCSDTIKPFTTGIYLNNVDDLSKQVVNDYYVEETDNSGNKLYLDKNGIVTKTRKYNTVLKKAVSINETIDFLRYPDKFTKIEVMQYKKNKLLLDSKYNDCRMYEFNISNFIDIDNSSNFDIGINDIKMHPDSIVKINGIKIDNVKEFSINVNSSNDILIYYSFDNNAFYKAKKNIKNDNNNTMFYLEFKNNTKNDIIIYDYQILFNNN